MSPVPFAFLCKCDFTAEAASERVRFAIVNDPGWTGLLAQVQYDDPDKSSTLADICTGSLVMSVGDFSSNVPLAGGPIL